MPQKVRKAVFPVAGLGTRFLPATKAIPKEMLPLADRPLIQHAVDEAKAAGIEQFCFVTSRGKSPLEDHFDLNYELNETLRRRGKDDLLKIVEAIQIQSGFLSYVRQAEPLGLGHAVWCAREFVGNEPFAVLLPDEQVLGDRPCLAQMMDAYDKVGGNMLSVFEVPQEQTNKYGILDIAGEDGQLVAVKGLVEKPEPAKAPSNLSIQGRYILQPEVFQHLSVFEKGAGGEIQLTDAMAKLIGNQPFHGFKFEGRRFDCGDKLGFVLANVAYALERPDMADKVRTALKDML
ncbi:MULTISPECIES: UTP--glucose-1-phosphate uridylyltransferase GalU [unclassified Azospirillum]|uniref:UTP--glucose-1-phosphate uridylyltransferase GalU n=1 Tax=unclassified Azospirillum TaxID=2630922 RepID=UPI000B754DCE|nr:MULTISPECIES: UTP--glucose-1-phosphate uridylyltransferase GalU [unclassified Azospirillum]SNR87083.1 UTP--glucose-1-phosphate uridylyltransferase [Azospirillum sp. RU38E]SNS03306.1 UTP--glucose-1-phosphate uridylyltransferase [Azospirillum sp. RU37A]